MGKLVYFWPYLSGWNFDVPGSIGLTFSRCTLKFSDRELEDSFLLSRAVKLANNFFIASTLMASAASMNFCIRLAQPAAIEHIQEAQLTTYIPFASLILVISISIASATFSKIVTLRTMVSARNRELVFLMPVLLWLVNLIPMEKFYIRKLLGSDIDEARVHSDASLLLALDAIITGTHLLLPMRWSLLLPAQLLSVSLYGMCFCLGSQEGGYRSALNLVNITGLVLASSIGKRAQEISERQSYAKLMLEQGRRSEAEQELFCIKTGSDPTSVSANTCHILSDTRHRKLEDLQSQLDKILELGHREHWLIDLNEVRLWPDHIIGEGGFGLVVAAEFHGTELAMKIAHGSKARDVSFMASLANELRIIRRVRHPNVVFFVGACVDVVHGDLALLFEWVRGRPLLELRRLVASPTAACLHSILVDISSALRYLHGQHPAIVHGDLSPSNILSELSNEQMKTKLLDFGLSRLLDGNARFGGGTREWKAPEYVLDTTGGARPTTAADVFTIGLLAYFVVMGKVPFGGVGLGNVIKSGQASPTLYWHKENFLAQPCMALCDSCVVVQASVRPSMMSVHTTIVSWSFDACEDSSEPLPGLAARRRCLLTSQQSELVGWRGIEILKARLNADHLLDASVTIDAFDPNLRILAASSDWVHMFGVHLQVGCSLADTFFHQNNAEFSRWLEQGVQCANESLEEETIEFKRWRGQSFAGVTFKGAIAVTFPERPSRMSDSTQLSKQLGRPSHVVTLRLKNLRRRVAPPPDHQNCAPLELAAAVVPVETRQWI